MLPMASLPVGTVTFLFSDIEGSTRLLQQLGDRYGSSFLSIAVSFVSRRPMPEEPKSTLRATPCSSLFRGHGRREWRPRGSTRARR